MNQDQAPQAPSVPSEAEEPSDQPRYPTVHVGLPNADKEEVGERLWALGATGLEERDASTLDGAEDAELTLVAHFGTEEEAEAAVEALTPMWSAKIHFIVGDAWRDGWKEFFKPARVGQRLWVRPTWEPLSPADDEKVILLDPGQAFGTGTHESTRLVLGQLEGLVSEGMRVLDVGCGSGILSVAALLLGASDAIAVDIDPIAARVSTENAEVNGVQERLRASTTGIADVEGTYRLVLANIRTPILIPMVDDLVRKVAPGGHLVLSGLLVEEEESIRGAYKQLSVCDRRTDGIWLSLAYRRPEQADAVQGA